MNLLHFFKRQKKMPWPEQELGRANVLYEKKDFAAALKIYQKIIRQTPDYLPAMVNIAQCYFELKNYAKASATARCVLTMDSQCSAIFSVLGFIALEQENFAEAIAHFHKLIELDSTDVWGHNYLSQALQKNGDFSAALAAAWQAVELSNGDDSQQLNFAYALYETATENQPELIVPYLQKWRQKYGADSLVKYFDSALSHQQHFNKADPVYVRKIFDNFADSFEDSLAALDYCVPQLIAKKIQQLKMMPRRILDLGCGTGLCGKFLDSLAYKKEICGVDLSAKMLAHAEQKSVYNQLVEADAEQFLATQDSAYDLIVAADVLTYFGALDSLFERVFSALDSSGFFIFSVSENNHDSSDCFLHLSGRFLHSENYLRQQLSAHKFELKFFEKTMLRTEGGQPVCGWIVGAFKA